MKGKNGGKIEAASTGIDYNKPLANDAKANIMASARSTAPGRKRGGAVAKASIMPDGAVPMVRLDKAPRGGKKSMRADGGKVGDRDYDTPGQKVRDAVDDANSDGRKRGGKVGKHSSLHGMSKHDPKRASGGSVSMDKMAEKAAGKMLSSATKPGRKSGGGVIGKVGDKIGADTHPISSANRTRGTRGHTTQHNIT